MEVKRSAKALGTHPSRTASRIQTLVLGYCTLEQEYAIRRPIAYLSAKCTVANARGYFLSFSLFGEFGRDAWPRREVCSISHGQRVGAPDRLFRSTNAGSVTGDLPAMTYPDPDIVGIMREIALSRSVQLNDGAFDKIATSLARLRHSQTLLLERLDKREISDEQYLEELNGRMSNYVAEVVKIAGRENAEKLLDDPTLQVDWLIDKDEFLKDKR